MHGGTFKSSSDDAPAIIDLLRMRAEQTPLESALLAPGRRALTYRQLIAQIDDAVPRLNALGIGRSSRVAMSLPDGVDTAAAFLCLSGAAVCMPLNPSWRARELEAALAHSRPSALVVPETNPSSAAGLADAHGIPLLELRTLPEYAGRIRFDSLSAGPRVAGDQARGSDAMLVLQTSGTSAAPKLVTLTHRNITAAALAIEAALELTPADRCLSVMPLFHIHGLSAIFASLCAGGSIVCPPAFSAPAFFDWLEEFRPTWYTASPTVHRGIVEEARRSPGRAARSSLRFIRSASSAMPRDLAIELEDLFQVPLLEAYGMTEAAPQIASNRLPPHIRKPGAVGKAAGPEIAIFDESSDDVKAANESGEIAIRGENVCVPGWLRTGDRGYLDDDGHLFITGRLTDVINRGGEKIAPQEVESLLLEHEAVREAAAFGIPHPTLGEHVAAAVVLRPGAVTNAAELRQFVAARIAGFKVPRPIVIVDTIPLAASGKLQRSRLPELLELLRPSTSGSAPDAMSTEPGAVETAVLAIFHDVLGTTEAGRDDDFFEAGGDSLSAMQAIFRINEAFGIDLAADIVFDHSNATALAEIVEARVGRERSSIEVLERDGDRPALSFAQQRLWVLDQLEPGNPAYTMQVALRCSGPLNRGALEDALTEIRRRHEVLRTTFPSSDGQPFAKLAATSSLRLPVISLARLDAAERDAETRRVAGEERAKPFHLAREPLFRALLVEIDSHDHVLLLTMHHIVSDGWSTTVLIRELGTLYESFAAGRGSPLSDLPIQYADFSAWHRKRLDDGVRATQLRHWRNALADLRTELRLPADRPRALQPTSEGAGLSRPIGRETAARLEALGRHEGATLFMTMLAAFQVLLLRYTGQEDIAVGTPVANRVHPSTEGLIGFFANTLVMRGDLSGDPSFRVYLQRVRAFARAAFANQDVPFEDVVDALRPARHAGRTPLFQVMFAFQNFPGSRSAFTADLDMAPYAVIGSSAKFDLTLYLSETADGLQALWQYRTDLFDETSIAGMADSYQSLLEGIVENPDCRLSALPLGARSDSAVGDGSTRRNDEPRTFMSLLAVQVNERPNAIAVRSGGDALTYRALDEKAEALAHRLRRNGVAGGTLVGVCLSRGTNAVVALLAVWKAGGVYLPLDPAYPRERLAFMLDDAQAAVLITESALLAPLPACDASIVCIDAEDDSRNDAVRPSPDRSRTATLRADPSGDLAYVIYTSGSTGAPKGVMITHFNIAHYLDAMASRLGVTADDRYLQTASFAFSSAMRQFLLPLSRGATVVIASTGDLLDPLTLMATVKAERITIVDLVPSWWRQLIRQLASLPPALRAGQLDNDLRLLLTASETLLSDLPAQWATFGHRARLVNMYGQTETTGIVATFSIPDTRPGEVFRVPIGKPIAGTKVNIVDSLGKPVPDGVVGELIVEGPTVGLGYLRRPDETAQRFERAHPGGRIDPTSRDAGPSAASRYRTGDLAQRLRDGTLVLFGRVDEQAKIRGFRIEPGEIEATLNSDPRVDQAAVVVRPGPSGEDQLAAFVVLAPQARSDEQISASFRAVLATRLPDYMVPAVIKVVDALPLTPTGKMNRAALAVREGASAPAFESPAGPEHPAQALLADLWSRLLGVDTVRPDDNFFDLGGDSLLGIRMIHEANVAGLALTPAHLFREQTLAALARVASQPARSASAPPSSPSSPIRVTLESARAFGEEALSRAGLSREHAALFTEVQLEASLRGQPTHNLGAIPRYARRLASGATNPHPEIRTVRESGVSALIDGDNGPGQLVALVAMNLAMQKAAENGVGVVGVRRSNHFGAAGHYVLQAAQRGLIGLCTTNSALWLAPTGSVTPLFGTNPLAVGFPSRTHYPIVLDVSMSVTAKGKVAKHLEEGRALAPGWILDSTGRPSIDPADLVAGLGTPMGGHKGYGLALVMEVLSGVLTGAGFGSDHNRERLKKTDVPADFGHLFIAIDPDLFASRSEFASRVDRMIDEVKGAKRMDGVEEILLPGESEMRARQVNLKKGVPLSAAVHRALEKYRREAGLASELVVVEKRTT